MPPKKKSEPSKKTVEKKKEKIIEDKTFGLKNKKGKKQQQFIKNVQNQVKYGQQSSQKLEAIQFEAKKKKLSELESKKEMDSLFKPVARGQKLSADADPKSVLCVFHKQGMCTKGDKCKFSHDLSLEGKSEKRSMYVDARDLENDTIDTWDEEKLKEVVHKKHGAKVMPKTEIVCKFFLQAIEDGKYGWFWECPGGDKCIYRHCLPPGFVFKTKKKGPEDASTEPDITMEQLVEEERQKLLSSGKTLTKVTLESFLAWKKRKLKEKKDKLAVDTSKKKEAMKAGRTVGISGREMFEFNPELKGEGGDGEDDEETVVMIQREDDEDDASGATAVDLTNFNNEWATVPHHQGDDEDDDDDDEVVPKGAVGGADPVQIDEMLFTEEDGDIPVDEELFDVDEDELLEEQLLAATINSLHIQEQDNSESDPESVE